MPTLFLTGSRFNQFGLGTVSVDPAEAAVAPKANLYDSDPSTPHIAGSIAADSYMRVRLVGLTNPGFESSTLSGWTDNDQGTGTSAETSTGAEVRTGTKALKMTGTDATTNYGSRYQLLTVTSGETRKATVYSMPISGTGTIFSLYLYNTRTLKYYNGSAWATTRAAAASRLYTGSPLYGATEITYTVEDFSATRSETCSLRWELVCPEGECAIDDVSDWPGVTFAGIFGHNYAPTISPLVQSSTDGSSWTTRATMTIARPAFYATFSAIFAEYWQIKLSGTPLEAPYTGEAVLGQYQESLTQIAAGPMPTWDIPGIRSAGTTGRPMVYNFATDATESVRLVFSGDSEAAAREAVFGMFVRSGQGRYPVIIVPTDTETFVYYGRLMQPFSLERPALGIYDWGIDLVGDPFPSVGL